MTGSSLAPSGAFLFGGISPEMEPGFEGPTFYSQSRLSVTATAGMHGYAWIMQRSGAAALAASSRLKPYSFSFPPSDVNDP